MASPDVTAAMFVYRTIEKTVFWGFVSIIMQNMSKNLLLFCTQTWPSPHVIENHLLLGEFGALALAESRESAKLHLRPLSFTLRPQVQKPFRVHCRLKAPLGIFRGFLTIVKVFIFVPAQLAFDFVLLTAGDGPAFGKRFKLG